MEKKMISFFVLLFVVLNVYSQKTEKSIRNELIEKSIQKDTITAQKDTKNRNYVPDEETAKKIAEAIWIPIFGEAHIIPQRPYKVKLVDDVWIVEGLIPEPYRYDPDVRGGGAYIEIQKSDCKILKVKHGR